MAIYPVLIFGCLLCGLSLTKGGNVPTMAISCGNTPLVTLSKYQSSKNTLEFKQLLSSLWNEDTKVIVALEDELSLEDFTMKGTDGHSLFKLFENAKDRRFFPSVNEPEKAVKMLSLDGFSIKAYNNETYLYNNTEKIVALVELSENNDDKNDDSSQLKLRRHNFNLSKIFNDLCKQYTNVILVLTGKLNPWIDKSGLSNNHHLVTRHLMATEPEQFILKDPKMGKALVFSASYPTLTVNNNTFPVEWANTDASGDVRDSSLKIGSVYTYNGTKITLRFRFERTTFTWTLNEIEYEEGSTKVLLKPVNNQTIGAQIGLSYFSKGPVIFANDSIILQFNDTFQVQPWLSTLPGSEKFSDPQAQDSFFTPPILAGLFVTALMLFIVTWGITMIMDIKTMDTFDDPKGKTISINVVE